MRRELYDIEDFMLEFKFAWAMSMKTTGLWLPMKNWMTCGWQRFVSWAWTPSGWGKKAVSPSPFNLFKCFVNVVINSLS